MRHPLKNKTTLCNTCVHCIYARRLEVVTCGKQHPKFGKTGVAKAIPVVSRCRDYHYGEHSSWAIPSSK